MLQQPFVEPLLGSQRFLIAGAGGGYDVFCGLPLYFALRSAGKQVWLANLSFTSLDMVEAERLGPCLVKIDAYSSTADEYFPEGYLARWLRSQGQDPTIYCFRRTGVAPLLAAYQQLEAILAPDTILLVDGGTDSLMRGDEAGLGTPHEDIASIAAVSKLGAPRKLLACLGRVGRMNDPFLPARTVLGRGGVVRRGVRCCQGPLFALSPLPSWGVSVGRCPSATHPVEFFAG